MKLSSLILLVTFALLVAAMFVSNILLKKEYDEIDKSDIYWTYGKVLQQPFKHLKIEGGNVTTIAFEQNAKSSVRVFKNWWGYENKVVKAFVKNDTLFLKFPNTFRDLNEKEYLRWHTLVRIFSPELLSIDGVETNIRMLKLKQKSIRIVLAGRSKLDVESYYHEFDSLHVTQRDSSKVGFKMSPDLMNTKTPAPQRIARQGQVAIHSEPTGLDVKILPDQDVQPTSWETMYVRSVDANVQGISLLDIGHAQVSSLKLNISDSSGIILSGGSLKKLKR